jgi:hypothetical protein
MSCTKFAPQVLESMQKLASELNTQKSNFENRNGSTLDHDVDALPLRIKLPIQEDHSKKSTKI